MTKQKRKDNTMTALLNAPLWLCPFIVLGIVWTFFLVWLGVALAVNAVGYLAAEWSKDDNSERSN